MMSDINADWEIVTLIYTGLFLNLLPHIAHLLECKNLKFEACTIISY